MADTYAQEFAFSQQLWYYYVENRGKIRSRYNDLTRKFLAYNDREENPKAFLRKPQFEALEMYVFIKEFMNNQQVYEMFDDWRNQRNRFADASYYSVARNGQISLLDAPTEKQTDTLFKQMKKYQENYPNYIYALTMGLGKTILMGTCIFYEFLLAKKYPKDKRFCHNALVFAPDKTVLQSLREIMTFDKTKVVPPEYARVLDANIKFHFLEEGGTVLNTIDDSDFNIIISNTQKIIVKKKRKEETPGQVFFNGSASLLSAVYGGDDEDDAWDDSTLMDNQRFKKLCRLPQLGVYVDEAHHLFGSELEKQIRSSGTKKTSLRDTINLLAASTSIVACYNYTGTPYVKNQMLPEVVYSYGLQESIWNGFLKDADPIGFENVKSGEFLKAAVTEFWKRYGGRTYEGLKPKLAVYAAGIDEAVNEVAPALERILADLGIPTSTILVNVGNIKYTKDEDIRNFNNLDVAGSEGNEKQFIILVEKGKEGWNCRSLFGVALYRSPTSKIFVLQATMRCLRAITDERLTATVFLSKENYDTLDDELHKNFNMELKDIKNPSQNDRHRYKVRVLPPPRSIMLKRIWHEYKMREKAYSDPVDFGLAGMDFSKYMSVMYERDSIARDTTTKEINIDHLRDNMKYSAFSLAGEIASYMNISCVLASRILREAADGIDVILEAVNKYNEVLDDIIVPKIFHALFEITLEKKTEDRELVLLRAPKDAGYYEFSAKDDLVITNQYPGFTPAQIRKSFHADTYCFDSRPELECFMQYIVSEKVKEIYFTGMFTANQGDLSIYYYDPESGRIRQYYPDFLAKMADGSYQLIEVKGDNKIDDAVVQAKKRAAEEMAVASGVRYLMYAGSYVQSHHILDEQKTGNTVLYNLTKEQTLFGAKAAEEAEEYGTKRRPV
ncbi:MAG: DEAD/DEAH box helicase family protein [Phascolarctobacterium sp.]|uniref:TnsA endonuclease N-terminal domain-containing protein n=1 Tax=Phascolarctobacterium sp. TaxID=2049039 RepID=UPI0026DD0F17|nr:TnsA endonuclease N-terminal domain-containing protein [Phascolarctobacterium sp.]MDO4922338.1 DEAD/DEAH box helicase family protein [Phascolarctobacterium sp.]